MREAIMPPIAAALVLVAPIVGATAQRTFVSGSGSDSNPCSIAAPCRSFGAAIAQTLDGGDIVVLDSAGYGPVSVTKNVAITAPAGVFAGISVFGGAGVDIATAGLRVVLRGLTITGLGGNVGVHVGAASNVTIERCDIATMLDYGIRADAPGAELHVSDTTVRASAVGISLTGTVVAEMARLRVHGNAGDGIGVYNGATAEIRDSDVSHNGNGINATSAGGPNVGTHLTLEGVVATLNSGEGVWIYTAGANYVTASIARSAFADNGSRGVRVECSVVSDAAYVYISDSRFQGNASSGVEFMGSAGYPFGYLARNTFAPPGYGVVTTGAGGYYSGGGNVAALYWSPASTGGF